MYGEPPLGWAAPRPEGPERGPTGGPTLSWRGCVGIETGAVVVMTGFTRVAVGECIRLLLGPVGGALNTAAAGPRGGDFATGTILRGTGERFLGVDLGVDLAESRSLKGIVDACGLRSRGRGGSGERALVGVSYGVVCCMAALLGWIGGEDLRDVLPDVFSDDRPEPRAIGDGVRRLQLEVFRPGWIRSSRRSGLGERRHAPLPPPGPSLRCGKGDLGRTGARSRLNGDLDRLGRSRRSSSLLSSLRGENRRRGLLALNAGDLGLPFQPPLDPPLGGVRSLRKGGLLDLRRGEPLPLGW